MPPGHNGPYHDPETPVRNTAHWLITFLKAYDISGDDRFLNAARKAATYLCSNSVRPMGATFWHRRNPHKDSCNGLIGQAWTIEALAVAAKPLDMPELVDLAREVFLLHPFDDATGLWCRVAADGTHLGLDMTFNHQLWFAAAGGLLAQYGADEVGARVRRFMDCLEDHLGIYSSGLIRHPLTRAFSWRGKMRDLISGMVRARTPRARRQMACKAVGYHAFNLYGLTLLERCFPGHPFWHSGKFDAVWHYAQSTSYRHQLEGNSYGYGYNPSGLEMAFALGAFAADPRANQRMWVEEQLRRCYDFRAHLMNRGTEDPVTHAARLYEATRLPDLDLELEG